MNTYNTVDRAGTLREGLVINLVKYNDIEPVHLQEHVNSMFPEGVSRHGEHFFLRYDSLTSQTSPSIEIFFEYVRRAFYSDKPSRFQSFFAFLSVDDAIRFREDFGSDKNSIWEVQARKSFQADMNLLKCGDTILMYSYLANKYWQGEPGPDPFWEVLLLPPVQILRKIDI